MSNMSLTPDEYAALVSLARKGSTAPEAERALAAFLRPLEARNGIIRSSVWVQWQEARKRLANDHVFPGTWPPTLRKYLEVMGRPVNKQDVQALLAQEAVSPVTVLITKDPGATLGWTELDVFFR
jgi:hypothetical protein